MYQSKSKHMYCIYHYIDQCKVISISFSLVSVGRIHPHSLITLAPPNIASDSHLSYMLSYTLGVKMILRTWDFPQKRSEQAVVSAPPNSLVLLVYLLSP